MASIERVTSHNTYPACQDRSQGERAMSCIDMPQDSVTWSEQPALPETPAGASLQAPQQAELQLPFPLNGPGRNMEAGFSTISGEYVGSSAPRYLLLAN
ncbi:MAG: hypothetical protein ACYCW6_24475 [Candidatus Xenobia bacterium]